MKLKFSKRQALKWGAIGLVVSFGTFFYMSDHEAPELEEISFSTSRMTLDGQVGLLGFEGRVTDARGINTVQLHCMDRNQTRIMIHLAITGGNRNRVSFGLDDTTYNWRGSWSGTRYDLSFSGLGRIPIGTPELDCDWFASLKDELGNSSWEPIGPSFSLRS